jgi:hypothetical protein
MALPPDDRMGAARRPRAASGGSVAGARQWYGRLAGRVDGAGGLVLRGATRPTARAPISGSTDDTPPWEYRQIDLGRGWEADEAALNEAGREGWEVVDVVGAGHDRTAYGKRQRPQEG